MKGSVNQLYDLERIEIPEEMLKISVEEEQIEQQLNQLSLRYAKECPAECAEQGDIVSCAADKTSYPDGRTILIYTGTPMPGAEQAAKNAVGKKIGDTFTAELCGKNAELTVQKIVHRTPVEVNDSFIASLGLEGIADVAAYRNYLREKALKNQRTERTKEINRYLLDEMIERCTYTYDEKEMEQYIEETLPQLAAEMAEMGMEEPPEEMRKFVVMQQKQNWIVEAFCKSHHMEIDRAEIEEEADRMIEMMTLMGEEVPSREEMLEMSLRDAYFTKLFEYMENLTAKKLGGAHGND